MAVVDNYTETAHSLCCPATKVIHVMCLKHFRKGINIVEEGKSIGRQRWPLGKKYYFCHSNKRLTHIFSTRIKNLFTRWNTEN